MKSSQIDLNLLVALEALLSEQNVTRAGRRIGLSQPAMSAALGKLREVFGDRLLERVGREYCLTPFARDLIDPVREVLGSIDHLLVRGARFDARTAQRSFRIASSDYVMCTLMRPTVEYLARVAPGIRLHFSNAGETTGDKLRARQLDLAVQPFSPRRGRFVSVPLFTDKWVCIAWREHAEIGEKLTPEQFGALPHVAYRAEAVDARVLARQLGAWTQAVRAQVTCESFVSLPFVLRGTRRIAVMQARLAAQLMRVAEIRVVDLPFAAPELTISMWWNAGETGDPAHAWLREVLVEVARTLP